MKIQTYALGMVSTNCHLAINETTLETIIIDPADKAQQIAMYIEEQGLKPVAILLTHGHFDHVLAIPGLIERYNIPVYVCEDEKGLLKDTALKYSPDLIPKLEQVTSHLVKDGNQLNLGGMIIKVIHTPGHTAGGVCYYFTQSGDLFSGDTLFFETVGRTDLPTGNYRILIDSLKNKLMKLPDDVNVYPGHGESTTIGHERINNPYIA